MSGFTCIACERELARPLRAVGTNSIDSICTTCFAEGHTIAPPNKPKGMTCPSCGVWHNSPEYHKCKKPANRVDAKRQAVRQLLRRQQRRCLGCRVRFAKHYSSTAPRADAYCIDHDHKNGKIRGLLCHTCNYVLGVARDNPAVLRDESRTFPAPYDQVDMKVRLRLANYLETEGTEVAYDPFST